jgi:hypothetical protein
LNHLVGTDGLEISGANTAKALEMASDTKVAQSWNTLLITLKTSQTI